MELCWAWAVRCQGIGVGLMCNAAAGCRSSSLIASSPLPAPLPCDFPLRFRFLPPPISFPPSLTLRSKHQAPWYPAPNLSNSSRIHLSTPPSSIPRCTPPPAPAPPAPPPTRSKTLRLALSLLGSVLGYGAEGAGVEKRVRRGGGGVGGGSGVV